PALAVGPRLFGALNRDAKAFLRHFDSRGAEAPRIERAGLPERLAQVLRQVLHDAQAWVLLCGRARRLHIDVSVTDDTPPRSAQKAHVLPSADSQVPMPRAALLALSHRDVGVVAGTPLHSAQE